LRQSGFDGTGEEVTMSVKKKVYTFAVTVACVGVALAAVAIQFAPATSGPHS
jgi:hypothetical protein